MAELSCISCNRDMTQEDWDTAYQQQFGYYWAAERTFVGHVDCESCNQAQCELYDESMVR